MFLSIENQSHPANCAGCLCRLFMRSCSKIHPSSSNTSRTSCVKSQSGICRSLYEHFEIEKWLIIAPTNLHSPPHSHVNTYKMVGQMETVLMPQFIHLESAETRQRRADWQQHMSWAFAALVQIYMFTTHTCHLLWLWLFSWMTCWLFLSFLLLSMFCSLSLSELRKLQNYSSE